MCSRIHLAAVLMVIMFASASITVAAEGSFEVVQDFNVDTIVGVEFLWGDCDVVMVSESQVAFGYRIGWPQSGDTERESVTRVYDMSIDSVVEYHRDGPPKGSLKENVLLTRGPNENTFTQTLEYSYNDEAVNSIYREILYVFEVDHPSSPVKLEYTSWSDHSRALWGIKNDCMPESGSWPSSCHLLAKRTEYDLTSTRLMTTYLPINSIEFSMSSSGNCHEISVFQNASESNTQALVAFNYSPSSGSPRVGYTYGKMEYNTYYYVPETSGITAMSMDSNHRETAMLAIEIVAGGGIEIVYFDLENKPNYQIERLSDVGTDPKLEIEGDYFLLRYVYNDSTYLLRGKVGGAVEKEPTMLEDDPSITVKTSLYSDYVAVGFFVRNAEDADIVDGQVLHVNWESLTDDSDDDDDDDDDSDDDEGDESCCGCG